MESAGSTQSTQQHAALLVACLVVVWGCNWPINKVVLNHIPPLWFACLRVGMGGLTFFVVQAFGTRGIRLPARSDCAVVISIGLFQVVVWPTSRHAVLPFFHIQPRFGYYLDQS